MQSFKYLLISGLIFFYSTISFSQLPSFNWVFDAKTSDPLVGGRSNFYDIVEDNVGNVITCGGYQGTVQFGQGATAVTRTSGDKGNISNYRDIVILKVNASGDLLWDITIGGNSNHNVARSIDVDDAGNIYVIGKFDGTLDFDPSSNVQNLVSTSFAGGDIFVAKYSASGDYIWAFVIQGNHWRQDAYDIAVNSTSGTFILGVELNTPVDVAPLNSTNISFATSGEDAAILVYDLSGNYIFGQNYFDNSSAGISAVHMDDDGNSYVFVGSIDGIEDIDPSSSLVSIPDKKAVLIKYDNVGNLLWYQLLNIGTNPIYCGGIEVDNCGDIITAGTYFDLSVNGSASNSYRTFVAKFDSTGNIQWQQNSISNNGNIFLGALPFDEYRNGGLAVDKNNNIYVMGSTGETNSPVNMTFGSLSISNSGPNGYIGYMTKFDTDGNSIFLEKIQTDGNPYYYNTNMFVSKNNTINICGYGVTPINIPFGGGLNGTSDYTSYLMNFLQDTTSLNVCEEDCMGIINGSSILDSCGVCLLPSDPTFNQSCTDCAGLINGQSVIDSCGLCLLPSDPTFNQSCTDCAGVINGQSVIDSCGLCLLPSDPTFNQSCTDCAGLINGQSVIDSCGNCLLPSDPTFNQSCTDCAGLINGQSVLDSCGICLLPSDPTFNQSCTDCAGLINGQSVLDSCGVCLLPSDPTFNQSCMDCAGLINGQSVIDSCGICLLPSDPTFNQSCTDCVGVINGQSVLDSCGICLLPSDPTFNQSCTDCAGVINGQLVIDSCGLCLLPSDPTFNQSCTDCAGVINGQSVIDSCGLCLLPSDPTFNQSCTDCAGVINGQAVFDSCDVCLLPNDPNFNLSCVEEINVFIPNAFSPNDDGYNDDFRVYKNDAVEAKINKYLIFSRWGELLYQANDFQFSSVDKWWDGTFNGKKMQTGVYVFYIEVEFENGALQKYYGDLFLQGY